MTARRRTTQEAHSALLSAAATVFGRKGLGGATTREIAELAGTSETAIYRRYHSKSDLFVAAAAEPFIQFLDHYRAVWLSQLDEQWEDDRLLRAFIGQVYDDLTARREALQALIAATDDPGASAAVGMAKTRIEEIFSELGSIASERARRVGGYAPERADTWLRLIVGMILSITAFGDWLLPGDRTHPSRDEVVDSITELVLHGIGGAPTDGVAGG